MLSFPKLYAIVDVEVCARSGWDPLDLARAFLTGGARLLQLRAKPLESRALLELARAIVTDADRVGATVVINDRADIARLSGAAGVHIGQEDLAVIDARGIVGPDAIVGLSTHTLEQAEAALEQPISYLAIGPVFGTRTKNTGYSAVGLETVAVVASRARERGMAVVAIGGITLASAASVVAAGVTSLAVITDLMSGDPTSQVRAYEDCLSR